MGWLFLAVLYLPLVAIINVVANWERRHLSFLYLPLILAIFPLAIEMAVSAKLDIGLWPAAVLNYAGALIVFYLRTGN
ncbi:MAG: hypothetical protein ABUJ93_10260 [Hyphomicrobium sp.]|jgi:hypothetical protein